MNQTIKPLVVINVMTKAQYDAAEKNAGELYFTTDETPAYIEDGEPSSTTTWSSSLINLKINAKLGAIDELLDIVIGGDVEGIADEIINGL